MKRLIILIVIVVLGLAATASADFCELGWTNTAAAIPTPRIGHGGGVYDGKVYVWAGYDGVPGRHADL